MPSSTEKGLKNAFESPVKANVAGAVELGVGAVRMRPVRLVSVPLSNR